MPLTTFVDPKKIETATAFSQVIDHTILKPDATADDIDKLCREAISNRFCAVCVNPSHVVRAANHLKNTEIAVATVVGFPLGATTTESKVFETAQAVGCGATEIDMVLNVGALKSGDLEFVRRDIRGVVQAALRAPVKVILETCLLTDDEKRTACLLSKEAGALYVKTSTGFGKSGATATDVKLMRDAVGATIGVKASGGIRTLAQAMELIRAGASRIGASASVAMIGEWGRS